jgi:hypothetical protein
MLVASRLFAEITEEKLPTCLVRLRDGVLVEVDGAPQNAFLPMSASGAPQVKEAAIGTAADTIIKVCDALADAVKKISEKVDVTGVEATVGLSFEVEGNLYIAKSKGTASINVKVTMGGS